MTREEAIEILKGAIKKPNTKDGYLGQALDMAIKALEQEPYKVSEYDKDHIWYKGWQYISLHRFLEVKKALEQEPCEDAISRQATIEAFQMFRGYEANRTNAEWVDRIETVVKKLPPVKLQEPKWDRLYSWLNDMRYGIAPDETVTDIDERNVRTAQVDLLDEIMEWIEKHPQEPKTGYWILTDDDFVYCSECEDSYYPRPIDASWYYCPHCGVRMVEPQESEGTDADSN